MINKQIDNKHPLHIKLSFPDKYTLHFNTKEHNDIHLDICNTYSYENNGYELHEGDLISFGNLKFKIKKIHIQNPNINNNNSNQTATTHSLQIQKQNNTLYSYRSDNNNNINTNSDNLPKCRICFSEEFDTETNPLITPCQCSGSIQFIHLICLKQWLESKITFHEYNHLNVLIKRKFYCELCKSPFPDNITIQTNTFTKKINLIDYPEEHSLNYFIMEYIPKQNKINDVTFIYTIKFDIKNVIYIGRANSSDLKMTDISVSRNHGMIQLKNGKFYVKDFKSKYGTFVEYKYNDILLLPNKVITLLIGKCLIEFGMKKTLLATLKCVNSKYFTWKDYNSYIHDKVNSEKGINVGRINSRKISVMKMINSKRSSNRELVDIGVCCLKNSFNKSTGLSLCHNSHTFICVNASQLHLLGDVKDEKRKRKEGVKNTNNNNNNQHIILNCNNNSNN